MINPVSMSSQSYSSSVALHQSPAMEKQGSEELTTVTTHCNKNHEHTPECPHTTFTRPASGAEGKGQYVDVFA